MTTATAASAQPVLGVPHPRLAGLERMAPTRRAAIAALSARHRALMADPAALATLDAACARLDPAGLGRPFGLAAELVARAVLVRQVPGEAGRLAAAAALARAHRLALLGTPLLHLGDHLDWHCDQRTGKHYPADLDYLALGRDAFALLVDRSSEAELKFAWDLSNLMWFPTLVADWHLHPEAGSAAALAADWTDWMEANPPWRGVNWFCPMNVAMRAVNAVAGLAGVLPTLAPALVARSLVCLFRHGLCILGHLELEGADRRNNHYLTNILGLYILGWVFRDLPLGAEWLDFATRELEAEALYHFHPDGVCFEDTTSYHRLSAEMLLVCAVAARRNGATLSAEFHRRLHAAAGFTRDLLGADHHIPQFGDNDNGRILQYHGFGSVACTDHRHLLAVAGEFYADPRLRAAGLGAEADALWQLGAWTAPAPAPGAAESCNYPQGGFHICRDGASTLVVRSGVVSLACGGGHAHCDQLSFTLCHRGRQVVVDPGCYRYSSDFAARNAFRSVAWHNTVQVDDLPMHDYDTTTFEGLWWMLDGAGTETLAAGFAADGAWTFAGRLHAYAAAANCRLERRLRWQAQPGVLEIVDRLAAADPARPIAATTRARARLLLAPGIEVEPRSPAEVVLVQDGRRLGTVSSDGPLPLRLRQLWFSPAYGSRVPAFQLEFSWAPAERAEHRLVLDLTGCSGSRCAV